MSSKENNSWVLVGKDGRTHDLSHGMIFIGREECDIVLQAASADKRHAVLCYNNSEQKFHIKDLNSLTGTYVNGIRIPEQTYVKLKRLDCIRFGYGPDVFYLEKSSSATSPVKEEPPASPQHESEKNSPEDNLKVDLKPNSKLNEAINKAAAQSCELPALTREDHPPDSLSLNLSSTRSTDKEWDWIGQDGTLSDSPDYSQRSETSSCSAPPNYGTATAEDRDTGSAHSSPAATAFTIAFETEASTPRKKLGIRDSISKFAPTKTDSENRVSGKFTSTKSDSEMRVSSKFVSTKSDSEVRVSSKFVSTKSESENRVSNKYAPTKSDAENRVSNKYAPTKSDAENRVSFSKNSKTEPSPKKLPVPDNKANVAKCRTQLAANEVKDFNEEIGKIAESTSFLIKRMLNGEMSPSDLPEEKSPKDKVHPNLQNDVNDDRSEAGTYTVETEEANCDVEEARKKIDEVFGVIQLTNSVLSSSYSSSTTSSSNKQIPRLNGRMKQNILKAPLNPKPRESTLQWNSANKTYGRSRGQGPTPAASTESLNHSDTLPRSLQRTRKISDPPPTPDRTRRSKLATSPKSPAKTKTPSTLKSPGSLSNNLSAAPSNRETANKEDVTRRRSTDSRSEGSKSPHTSAQWQKVPWNLSGSDLDLDRSKSENNSILSDTSTEPSSHSSHSGQSRPEQGPQMRLNRAFALRRARLEAESGKRGKENRTSTVSNQQKPMKKSSKLSSSTSTLRDESSSGSSSKINFRVTPNITKPFVGRQMVQCTDPLKRKNEIKGGGHRRIESDPGKGIPVWKTDLRPVTSDHDDKGAVKTVPMDLSLDESRLQTFHRSVSCSIVNETDVPKSKVFHRGTLSHRDFPASLLKNIDSLMSGSQIMSSHNMDEYQCRGSNKEITALDSLVISAIHQLASKLWANSKELLERERKKCPKGSDTWLMIDEVLPQGPVTGTPEDGDFTKDLSSILKNLKRVEQGLDVLSSILENGRDPEPGVEEKTPLPQNFFVVNM